VRSKQALLES